MRECENKTRVREKNTGIIYTVIDSKPWNIGQVKILHIKIFIIRHSCTIYVQRLLPKFSMSTKIFIFIVNCPVSSWISLEFWEMFVCVFAEILRICTRERNQNRLSILSGLTGIPQDSRWYDWSVQASAPRIRIWYNVGAFASSQHEDQ